MSDNERSANGPLLIAAGLLVVALLIPALGKGVGHGSILGALVAFVAIGPAGYAAWLGVQSKTQGKLLGGMVLMLAGVAVGAALILLKFFAWLR